MDVAVGATAIDVSTAPVTVSCVLPLMEPEVAVIVAMPWPTLVARPLLPVVLLMVATPPGAALHVTELVKSCVELSLKLPSALNCCDVPNAIDGLAGVTEIETRTAGWTVKTVEPAIEPKVAVIVVEPCDNVVACPCVPALLVMVATAWFEELQFTLPVMSCVIPFV